MEALCFTLSGKTAFFKKPEVNTYVYFTYGNIHKVALLGIFGAILGYGGYTQQFNETGKTRQLKEGYPDFYEKLQGVNVSIIPNAPSGFIRKKIQVFNNSVGYASKEQGGNLIVKEQWLEDPSWDVYVLLDCDEAKKLCKAILKKSCVYIPYLGKNDHFADITSVCVKKADAQDCGKAKVASLFPRENGVRQVSNNFWDDERATFQYEEKLPVQLDAWTNNYILRSFIYTDAVISWENQKVYGIEGRNIMFF